MKLVQTIDDDTYRKLPPVGCMLNASIVHVNHQDINPVVLKLHFCTEIC